MTAAAGLPSMGRGYRHLVGAQARHGPRSAAPEGHGSDVVAAAMSFHAEVAPLPLTAIKRSPFNLVAEFEADPRCHHLVVSIYKFDHMEWA